MALFWGFFGLFWTEAPKLYNILDRKCSPPCLLLWNQSHISKKKTFRYVALEAPRLSFGLMDSTQ